MIRAKMKCESITGSDTFKQVKLRAVYSEDKTSENYSFSQATPSATVDMGISNPAAFGAFQEGKEYYVDFTPA